MTIVYYTTLSCFIATTTSHPTFSRRRRYTCSCVGHKLSRLLWQSPDWRSKQDDRQVATCIVNSAARVVFNTRTFDRGLTHFQRKLHRLDVVDRVRLRVCAQVFRCLYNMAPGYLSTLCQPVSGVPGRRHLRSADCGHPGLPSCQTG